MEPDGFFELFNWLDIVLGIGLVAAFLVGLGAGFYRQVAITASLVAGALLASQFTQPLAATDLWQPVATKLGPEWGSVSAYATIILGALLVGLLSILIFRSTFGRTLRFVDSILGGAAGVTIGALLFGLVILGVCHWQETRFNDSIRESYLGARLAQGARVFAEVFPEDVRSRVESMVATGERLVDPGQVVPASAVDTEAKPIPATDKR